MVFFFYSLHLFFIIQRICYLIFFYFSDMLWLLSKIIKYLNTSLICCTFSHFIMYGFPLTCTIDGELIYEMTLCLPPFCGQSSMKFLFLPRWLFFRQSSVRLGWLFTDVTNDWSLTSKIKKNKILMLQY